MKIIVDAFGGDNAPLEIIKGCADSVAEFGINIILTGKEETIRNTAKENNISLDGIEIADCEEFSLSEIAFDSLLSIVFSLRNSS